MNFSELPEFRKEFKRLARKYKSLPDDLREFCSVVSSIPLGNGKHFAVIAQTERIHIIKVRFFCRCLKGSSLRIVYAHLEEKQRIEFIGLYYKGDKENEDCERIKDYLKNQQE